jgi:hypothetical protein
LTARVVRWRRRSVKSALGSASCRISLLGAATSCDVSMFVVERSRPNCTVNIRRLRDINRSSDCVVSEKRKSGRCNLVNRNSGTQLKAKRFEVDINQFVLTPRTHSPLTTKTSIKFQDELFNCQT